MYFKLAAKNVRKSVKDYTIYFLTLTFGVCLFYVFNSIESQQSMLDISESQDQILQSMTQLLAYVSVFIAFVLGFLIIYANNFLIKRRKKELGLYMTLGMDRGKISRILIGETFVIGLVALAVGLLAGVFASQGLSVVTAQMFGVSIKRFEFVFSPSAVWKSILCFGVIFLIVMAFNTVTVSRCQLIDLLYGGRRNEKLRVKSLGFSMVLFLLSAGCLGIAYYWILQTGLLGLNGIIILLGCVGTLLFFLSLSGFLLRLVKSSKGIYYKGLNMFVLRQINSKITTNSISMSMICLMLFVALCTLSCGAGLANAMNGDLQSTTVYDASVRSFLLPDDPAEKREPLSLQLEKAGIHLEDFAARYEEFILYESNDVTYGSLIIDPAALEAMGAERMKKIPVDMIALSDYNRQMLLQGREPITLKAGEFAVNANFDQAAALIQPFLEAGKSLTVEGRPLTPGIKKILDASLYTTFQKEDGGTLIVPDEIAALGKPKYIRLNLQYAGNAAQTEKRFLEAMKDFGGRSSVYTKIDMIEQGSGMKTTVYYIALYIGIVFLITCSAVLALQQLSESSDNVARYTLLQKIGTEKRMLNRALFWQILIYFMVPLTLALVHSYIGIRVSNQVIQMFGNMDITQNILFAAGVILLIYGGYFVATYFGSKNIITNKTSNRN